MFPPSTINDKLYHTTNNNSYGNDHDDTDDGDDDHPTSLKQRRFTDITKSWFESVFVIVKGALVNDAGHYMGGREKQCLCFVKLQKKSAAGRCKLQKENRPKLFKSINYVSEDCQ